jgi:hypothetical protein
LGGIGRARTVEPKLTVRVYPTFSPLPDVLPRVRQMVALLRLMDHRAAEPSDVVAIVIRNGAIKCPM